MLYGPGSSYSLEPLGYALGMILSVLIIYRSLSDRGDVWWMIIRFLQLGSLEEKLRWFGQMAMSSEKFKISF